MAKWIVRYEYEMPGWDEFGKTDTDHIIVEADNADGAMEAFRAAEAANTGRNSLKFSFTPHSIEPLD